MRIYPLILMCALAGAAPVAAQDETPTFEAAGSAAAASSSSDVTLQDIVEYPSRMSEGATYVIGQIRVTGASPVEQGRYFAVALADPASRAGTSTSLRSWDGGVTAVFQGTSLREILRARPELTRMPARVRGQWLTMEGDYGRGTAYLLRLYSVEWLRADGSVEAVAH